MQYRKHSFRIRCSRWIADWMNAVSRQKVRVWQNFFIFAPIPEKCFPDVMYCSTVCCILTHFFPLNSMFHEISIELFSVSKISALVALSVKLGEESRSSCNSSSHSTVTKQIGGRYRHLNLNLIKWWFF